MHNMFFVNLIQYIIVKFQERKTEHLLNAKVHLLSMLAIVNMLISQHFWRISKHLKIINTSVSNCTTKLGTEAGTEAGTEPTTCHFQTYTPTSSLESLIKRHFLFLWKYIWHYWEKLQLIISKSGQTFI